MLEALELLSTIFLLATYYPFQPESYRQNILSNNITRYEVLAGPQLNTAND